MKTLTALVQPLALILAAALIVTPTARAADPLLFGGSEASKSRDDDPTCLDFELPSAARCEVTAVTNLTLATVPTIRGAQVGSSLFIDDTWRGSAGCRLLPSHELGLPDHCSMTTMATAQSVAAGRHRVCIDLSVLVIERSAHGAQAGPARFSSAPPEPTEPAASTESSSRQLEPHEPQPAPPDPFDDYDWDSSGFWHHSDALSVLCVPHASP